MPDSGLKEPVAGLWQLLQAAVPIEELGFPVESVPGPLEFESTAGATIAKTVIKVIAVRIFCGVTLLDFIRET